MYENCPAGTQVTFYTEENPGPLGKPTTQLITEDEQVRGWDPTDSDENNPWKNYVRPEKKEEDKKENNENTTQNNENNNNIDNNNVVGNNELGNNTSENNSVGNNTNNNTMNNNLNTNTLDNNINNNTVDNNTVDNNTVNNNTTIVPENKVLEENDDVTIKSEVVDTNTL